MEPSSQEVDDAEELEEAVLAEITSSMVSWPGFQVSSEANDQIREVCKLLREGADLWGQWAKVPKWNSHRGEFMETEGILTFKGRAVDPRK